MTPSRATLHIATLAALVAPVAACATGSTSPEPEAAGVTGRAPADRDRGPAPSRAPSGPEPAQEQPVRIGIDLGAQQVTATLHDSAAATDLAAMLPVTVAMADHGGVEKTGPLPSPLSLDGQPEGAEPDAGDLGYYAPGQDLVLYHGDQGYYPGIVVLGRLDVGAAPAIASIDGDVTAVVTALD